MKALTALAAAFALLLPATAIGKTLPIRHLDTSERTAQIELHTLAQKVAGLRASTWRCQDQLGITRTRASAGAWALPTSIPYRRWVVTKWKAENGSCGLALTRRAHALANGQYGLLSDRDLYAAAAAEIRRGGIYSERWGDASPTLKALCYEAVRRQFSPFGTQEWAHFIVNRESGCNPGAVNSTYSSWDQRARGVAQLIPAYHRWVDYMRYRNDLRYAVGVFVRLSDGGKSVGPWACC